LTGAQLPADPKAWEPVIAAGGTIAPEPNGLQRAVNWATDR
jgi:hypothetical protein